MTATADPASELVAAARDLFPVLDAAWAQSDEQRRVPSGVVEQIRSAGLFHMFVPHELGGAQVGLDGFVQVLETLAYGLGAAAWDVATSSIGGLYALGLPREGLDVIYGRGPDVVFAGTVTTDRDASRATVAEGGYIVSGRWRFGSGCQDADRMIASTLVCEDDQPRLLPDGTPEFRYVVFPRDEVQVLDTWRVLGMRGTGSHDWTVAGHFLPEKMTQSVRLVQQGGLARAWPGALYRFPLASITALHFSAVAAGLARRAIDSLVELASAKVPHRSPGLLRERVQAQEAVAKAEVALESARAYRDRVLAQCWSAVERGEELDPAQRARMRLAGTYLAESAARAVDLMYEAGGTTSIEEDFSLARCFRDVHVVVQSITVSPLYYETAGRAFLDLGPAGNLPF